MIVHVSDNGETALHRCDAPGCGYERTLRVHLKHGDFWLEDDLLATADTVTTRPCPRCGSVESFRLDIAPHECGEGPQPEALTGQELPDGGGGFNVVHEHVVGWLPDMRVMAHARRVRALGQHKSIQAAREALRVKQHRHYGQPGPAGAPAQTQPQTHRGEL